MKNFSITGTDILVIYNKNILYYYKKFVMNIEL